MRQVVPFQILYPVTDFSQTPATHFTDLMVHANCYQFGDGSLQKDDNEGLTVIDIDSILYDDRNITSLLLITAENFYNDILAACRAHADKEIDQYKEDQIENGADAAIHSEEWTNAQAEQDFFDKQQSM